MTLDPRKVILDVDGGIDDALALTIALFDPRIEVTAVTAVGGSVPPERAARNVQTIVETLDPPRWPRVGAPTIPERPLPADNCHIYGADGLGNSDFAVSELHHLHPSAKIIADEIRAAPEEVTIVCLGPLTNIAGAFRRDPALASQVGQLVIMGGALAGGNVTPAAEFNIYCDPGAAREVFRQPATMTLVPLDITKQVAMTFGDLDRLPAETTRAGKLLRRILPFAFRTHRQEFGLEGMYLHDTVALVAALHPELFVTERMAADVETQGELTAGETVFDRRSVPQWRHNVYVATKVDAAGVMDVVIRGIKEAARAS
ncbi:MAG TPA: nucleoside hydrolase [Pirellulales bacterium]|nr:nucleoside hydrolase [Pirellulales bacterium]